MENNLSYLIHIIEATGKIERYLEGFSEKDFYQNEMRLDAVVRELEIIGEAANNISEDYKKQHPEIPWRKMIGMRNRLMHEYFGINKKIVWDTCQIDLKELKVLISPLIEKRA